MPTSITGMSSPGWGDARRSESPLTLNFDDPTTFSPTRGEWTVVTGTAPVVSGGVASPFDTSEHVVTRTAENVADVEVVAKITTSSGSLGAGSATWSILARFLDASNFLMARIGDDGSSSARLEIYKRDGGTFTALNALGAYTIPLSTGTAYWLRARFIGNVITIEAFTAEPGTAAPTATVSITLTGGDATKFGAGVRGPVGLRHSSVKTYTLDDLIIRPLGRPPRQRDVQVFTSTGTWTKPAGAAADPNATTTVLLVASGSGGGSGRRGALATNLSGGGGGAGGGFTWQILETASLGATALCWVPAGGVGGAAVTTDDTDGNPGTQGGKVYFLTTSPYNSQALTLKAYPGGAGSGGRAGAAGNAGGNPGTTGYSIISAGGTGNSGGPGGDGAWSTPGTSGGGGGGGLTTGTSPQNGGRGGGMNAPESQGGSVGVAPGGAGGAGGDVGTAVVVWGEYRCGYGGGGGASSHTGAGGAGGAGGGYGGGGGGGGASRNGNNSGAGGDGGPGIVIAVTEWGG